MREWLNAQAAGGYVEYDPDSGRYRLPPEQAVALTDSDSPAYLPGFFQIAVGSVLDSPRITEAARSGDGRRLARARPRRPRGLRAVLPARATTPTWSRSGCRRSTASSRSSSAARCVADVGCGHGASTILMAQAFPNSTFVGSDYHDGSIETARRARAARPGVADRVTLPGRARGGVQRRGLRPRHDVRLPARHGRSGRRRAPRPRDAQARRHVDDRRAARRRPRRGQPQPGRPRLLRVLDAALHAGVAVPGGRAGARRAGRRGADPRRRRRPAASPASAASPRRPSTWCSKRASDRTSHAGLRRPRAGASSRAPACPSRPARATRTPRASSSATACGSSTRSTARASGRSCSCRPWSIVHSRFWKLQIPYLARHFRVVTFDGRGQRPLRPARRRRGVPRATSSPPTRSRCWTRPAPSARCSSALSLRRAVGHRCSRPTTPSASRRRLHRPRASASRRRHPERDGLRVRRAARRPTRAGRRTTATTGRATTAASSSSSSASASPSRTRPSRSRTAIGWALETTPETLRRHDARRSRPARRDASRDAVARVRCPVLVIHGDDDLIRPHAQGERARRGDRRRARHARGRRPLPARARPGAGQPAAARLRLRRRRRRRAGGAAARTRRSARCTSRRRSASATRGATSRSPRAARARARTSRSTGSRRTRSRAVLEARGERIHPASAQLAERVARTSQSESREHELNVFQAWRRMDEILLANFMVFHDVVRDEPYDLWIGDEAWELDYFLHENPELKTAAVRVADRLRRLAADARGRRARGVPDRRLQRRDDRAHRALPARARPGDLRRRARRHRARHASGPGCPRSASGPRQHFDFTGYVTGFDPAALADRARAARRARATGPTSRSASSRSAARASASICCDA